MDLRQIVPEVLGRGTRRAIGVARLMAEGSGSLCYRAYARLTPA